LTPFTCKLLFPPDESTRTVRGVEAVTEAAVPLALAAEEGAAASITKISPAAGVVEPPTIVHLPTAFTADPPEATCAVTDIVTTPVQVRPAGIVIIVPPLAAFCPLTMSELVMGTNGGIV
jgi:hypothetical protein